MAGPNGNHTQLCLSAMLNPQEKQNTKDWMKCEVKRQDIHPDVYPFLLSVKCKEGNG